MVRTKASQSASSSSSSSSSGTARRAVAEKAPRKLSAGSSGHKANNSHTPSSSVKETGLNPICVRQTPGWQKPISLFFGGSSKCKDMDIVISPKKPRKGKRSKLSQQNDNLSEVEKNTNGTESNEQRVESRSEGIGKENMVNGTESLETIAQGDNKDVGKCAKENSDVEGSGGVQQNGTDDCDKVRIETGNVTSTVVNGKEKDMLDIEGKETNEIKDKSNSIVPAETNVNVPDEVNDKRTDETTSKESSEVKGKKQDDGKGNEPDGGKCKGTDKTIDNKLDAAKGKADKTKDTESTTTIDNKEESKIDENVDVKGNTTSSIGKNVAVKIEDDKKDVKVKEGSVHTSAPSSSAGSSGYEPAKKKKRIIVPDSDSDED